MYQTALLFYTQSKLAKLSPSLLPFCPIYRNVLIQILSCSPHQALKIHSRAAYASVIIKQQDALVLE